MFGTSVESWRVLAARIQMDTNAMGMRNFNASEAFYAFKFNIGLKFGINLALISY